MSDVSLAAPDAPPDTPLSNPLSMAVSAQDRDTIAMVREALDKQHAMLAFQPVVQTAQPDQMAFYEGLIRVMDHKGRIIPARDFIGVVEDKEMGRLLDTLALEKGLEALAAEPGLRLSINMSARSIGYARWQQALKDGLARDKTVAERLIFEITERTAITMPDIVQAFMSEMQMHGISFALDNFGAGYTSFKCLKDFYFDIMKIDGEFIRGIHKDPDNQVLTKALLSIARHFDMFTVAENVGNYEDAEVLADMGVDCMQGYYFGVPTITPYWQKTDPRRMAG